MTEREIHEDRECVLATFPDTVTQTQFSHYANPLSPSLPDLNFLIIREGLSKPQLLFHLLYVIRCDGLAF